MTTFKVPTRDQVTASNQTIFDNLKKSLGMVPNLYATFAHSSTALADFLNYANRKSSLTVKEKEVINITVSQQNDCAYCLAAHTAIGKMSGFTDSEILDIRSGIKLDDVKLNSLSSFVRSAAKNNSKPSPETLQELIAVGYSEENVVDIVLAISVITATNYLHGITQIPVDFPTAPTLGQVTV